MTNPQDIATRYMAAWNETDAKRRRELVAALWTEDATYVDPMMKGDGRDGIEALISGVQTKFPDHRFALIGTPDGYGDHVRFSWQLGPTGGAALVKGTDFAVVSNGRLKAVTGFIDQLPPGM